MSRGKALLAAICAALALVAGALPAHAQKRIALLIGNQGYTAEIGRLANPHNDIALLEKTLKELRFEVTVVRDAGLASLHQAVNAHVRRIKAAGPDAIAFTYYSGHGASDGTTNYLIPVDVKTADDDELWDHSLRLTQVTKQLRAEAGNATHFVVFDACRNVLKLRKPGSRSLVQSKGFAAVAQESGMLIAYSTAEGELASDVGQGAGPYAKMLAEEIVKPGVEAVTMFRRVQVRVRSAIGQEPWLGFSAIGEVHLGGTEAPNPSATTFPRPDAKRWKKMIDPEPYAKNYVRHNLDRNDYFPHVVTVFEIPMSSDRRSDHLIEPDEYLEIFKIDATKDKLVIVKIRLDRKHFWLLSRRSIRLDAYPGLSTLDPSSDEATLRIFRFQLQNEIDRVRHILRTEF